MNAGQVEGAPLRHDVDVEASHTPGPWAVNPFAARVDAIPSLLPVCQMLWPTDERSESETEANARLIAAAPDLLAALRDLDEAFCLSHEHMTREQDAFCRDALNAARAAIAKATQP